VSIVYHFDDSGPAGDQIFVWMGPLFGEQTVTAWTLRYLDDFAQWTRSVDGENTDVVREFPYADNADYQFWKISGQVSDAILAVRAEKLELEFRGLR
jgi:hypothetical protein